MNVRLRKVKDCHVFTRDHSNVQPLSSRPDTAPVLHNSCEGFAEESREVRAKIMLVTDYTSYPFDEMTQFGKIVYCPLCGRRGAVRRENGVTFYTHKFGFESNDLDYVADYCPPPTPRL